MVDGKTTTATSSSAKQGLAGRTWAVLATWAAAAVVLAVLLWVVAGSLAEQGREQGAVSLRDAVLQTAMQCYAIEGIYPQDLAYLEERYGLTVNHDLYAVTYEAFASNVMPSVVVTLR